MINLPKLIFREDSFHHLTGSFFGMWLVSLMTSSVWVAPFFTFVMGCAVEFYQWHFGTHYPHKKADTVKDLIMDLIGITLAVLAIRGK